MTNMANISDRYTRLCQAYVQLADRFQKLDVEHMTLRSKIVPFLKALKIYKQSIEELEQEKRRLEQELQAVTFKYEELKPLEAFLKPETQAALEEAEEQIALVDETIREMESNRDPDLSDADKLLLDEYYSSEGDAPSPDVSQHHSNIIPFAS